MNYYWDLKKDDELLYHKVNEEPIEIKIVYREKYEPVNIQKNYSSLHGQELQEMKDCIINDDFKIVESLKFFSIEDSFVVVAFLKMVFTLLNILIMTSWREL